MATPKDLLGVKGDECQCGRRASIKHCPSCGSRRLYARLNRYHKCMDGQLRLVENQFRCQTCGHLSIDEEMDPRWCSAPPVSAALAQQKIRAIAEAEATGEHLRPNDIQLAQALKQMGITAEAVPKEVQLKQTWFQLKNAYIDAGETVQSMSEFLETHLKGSVPEDDVKTILKWQREEDLASARETSK